MTQATITNPSRTFQAYCVGNAKSGTASMYGLFQATFRSAHEPERSDLLKRILAEADGSLHHDEFVEYLRERDQRLWLEFDSSWVNHFIINHLVRAFPNAKFILLIRDCYTWVESVINHMLTRKIPADVRELMDWWFEPRKYPHKKEDQALEEMGLFSLECYLNCWKSHATKSAEMILAERLLILRTHEIRDRLDSIAQFLQIPRERLDGDKSHLNKGTREKQIISLVDRAFLEDTVARICHELMGRYFPEIKSLDDAYALWGYQN